MPRQTLEERFWSKVDRRGPDECWEWQAYRNHSGYGQFGIGGRAGGMHRAHRISYELMVGPIPEGLHVLHRCDNPPCVNPAHLWLGTHAENQADKAAKGRSTRGRRVVANAKLSDADLAEIHRLASLGLSRVAIAARFPVDRTRISQIVRGKAWERT